MENEEKLNAVADKLWHYGAYSPEEGAKDVYTTFIQPLEQTIASLQAKLEKEPRYFELEWQQQKPRFKALLGHDNAYMIEQYVNTLLEIAEGKVRLKGSDNNHR